MLSKIPIKTVAWRVNIFSAICTTMTCANIGFIVNHISAGGHRVSGVILTMGMFAFSPLIWQYAVTAEVFPLNTLFASILLLLSLKFTLNRNLSIVFIGAFVSGLALCNQHTIVLYIAPLILWILWLLRNELIFRPMTVLPLAGAFLLGLSLYVYLPVSASLFPQPGSWGHVATMSGFLHHFLRRDYGTFRLFSGAAGKHTEDFFVRSAAYAEDLFYTQGLYVCPILAVLGLLHWHPIASNVPTVLANVGATRIPDSKSNKDAYKSKSRNRLPKKTNSELKNINSTASHAASSPTSECPEHHPPKDVYEYLTSPCPRVQPQDAKWFPYALLITQIVYFGVFHSLANLPLGDKLLFGVHQRFWMQPNVLLFTWSGLGLNALIDVAASFHLKKSSQKPRAAIATSSPSGAMIGQPLGASLPQNTVLSTLGVVFACACVLLQLASWSAVSDQRAATHFRDYAHALLDPLPDNSLLLINYDMQWTAVRYVQKCEGHRADVTAINLSMMTYHWFQHKRELYPNISFPGLYHGSADRVAAHQQGAFSMHSFVTANIDSMDVFLGGKFSFKDPLFEKDFELAPFGLVSKVVPLPELPPTSELVAINTRNWKVHFLLLFFRFCVIQWCRRLC